jgi:uroporphyrinogen-III decarboxylase
LTHRERILAVLAGKKTDHVPYFPDLFYWYRIRKMEGEIPPRFRGMKLYDIYRELDCGICRHVYQNFVKAGYRDSEFHEEKRDDFAITTIRTPAGSVQSVRKKTPDSHDSYFPIEFPVKTLDDLKVMVHVTKDRALTADPSPVARIGREIGGQGVYTLVQFSSPLRRLLTEWMGLERGFLFLHDHPEACAEAMEVIDAGEDEMTRITCETPGEIVIIGDNVDKYILPPPHFRKYQVPYYRKRAEEFRRAGKVTALHMDGRLQGILPLMRDSGIDVLDGLTPAPVGDYTPEEVRDALGPGQKCWCGVPAPFFCDETPTAKILDWSRHIVEVLGDRLILNVADQVPPNADIEKVGAVARLVREIGPV